MKRARNAAILAISLVVLTYVAGASSPALAPRASAQPEFIPELTRDTWTYLSSDWARSNHLPWSWRSATLSGGSHANSAEIGFLALAWLAAYDAQESWSPEWSEAEAEVTAILEQLRAWQSGSQAEQPHGPNAYASKVFYQWYWISWNPPVVSGNAADRLVPSIDNAWLAASLITIREYAEANDHPGLATRADQILADMDFLLWYDSQTHLFTWGGIDDPQGGFPADYYSNENRIINFVARALGQLSQEEYALSLGALQQYPATYDGITVDKVAWDGSYFTYAAPALFAKEMWTAYGMNTIEPATQAQIAYAQDQGYEAWGLSDAYDVGAGDYVKQGAPPTGMAGSPEARPGLVTPHASALAMITPLATEAGANLQKLADDYDCAYDDTYGFLDSVIVKPDAPDYGQCSERFSALAQEWTFLTLVNYEDGFIWDYFYRDAGVIRAHVEMFGEHLGYLPFVR